MPRPADPEQPSAQGDQPQADRAGDAFDVAPLDVDGVAAVATGTVLWTVALVVLLLLRTRVDEAGWGRWIGVCAAGALLGAAGMVYVLRRRDALRRRAGDRPPTG